ncbi:hypothetical protein ACLB1Q_28480 [Escherichia coli]
MRGNPHWAWVSPSVYERTFCSAGIPAGALIMPKQKILRSVIWKCNWRHQVRHQVAAFMERRGMGGLIRGGL